MNDKQWCKLMSIGEKLGCHQMPERSFFYKEYQFPVCARCTGVILSSIVSLFVFLKKKLPIWCCIIMSGIMFGDWFIQFIGWKKSNNKRRLITGLIGGFGYSTLHLYLYHFICQKLFSKNEKKMY